MLNLDADEQEINLANNDILQVVPVELHNQSTGRSAKYGSRQNSNAVGKDGLRLVVLKLDVQTVFNSDLHLD